MKFILVLGIIMISMSSMANPLAHTLAVTTYQIKLLNGYKQSRILTGQVFMQQEAELGFEFAGKVTDILVDQGDWVKNGQVMAKQDDRLLNLEKSQMTAQITKVQAQLKLANIELSRLLELSEKHYSAAQQLDELRSRIEVLNADHNLLLAQRDSVTVRIEKTSLFAPFAGIVNARHVAQGEITAPQSRLFSLIKQNSAQVELGVPAHFAQFIQDKTQITILGQQYDATLLSRGGAIDPISRTLSMRFALPEGAPVFSGALAIAYISTFTEKQGTWVPLTALTDGLRGTWLVYSVENGQVVAKTVQVHFTDGSYAYISGQLEGSTLIMANGLHKAAPGVAVEIVSSITNRSL